MHQPVKVDGDKSPDAMAIDRAVPVDDMHEKLKTKDLKAAFRESTADDSVVEDEVLLGLGRIVALHYCSSTSYQIH